MGKMAADVALNDGHHGYEHPNGVLLAVNCHSRGHIQDAWAQESPSIVLAEDHSRWIGHQLTLEEQGSAWS